MKRVGDTSPEAKRKCLQEERLSNLEYRLSDIEYRLSDIEHKLECDTAETYADSATVEDLVGQVETHEEKLSEDTDKILSLESEVFMLKEEINIMLSKFKKLKRKVCTG